MCFSGNTFEKDELDFLDFICVVALWEQKRRIAFNVHVEPYAKAERNDGCVSEARTESSSGGSLCPPREFSAFLLLGEERAIWKHLMKGVGPPRNSQNLQGDYKVELRTEAVKVGWRFS